MILLTLRAGSSTRESGGTTHSLTEIIMHPDYDNVTINFDIAILKVCMMLNKYLTVSHIVTLYCTSSHVKYGPCIGVN